MPDVGGRVVVAPVAEQAHHALLALAPAADGGVDDVFEHRQQPAPRMAERVERAALDQRLDRALVEHRLGDALDEVVEARERAVLVALGDEQLDEPLADVAHRRETERDRARAADRQGDVVRHLFGRAGRRSWPTDRLTSGGSTLMPIDRQSARYVAALSRLLFTLVSRQARYSTG